MSERVTGELRESIFTITINRPEKKNAIDLAMYRALADLFAEADAEAGARVILVTGAGGCFTSGNDLADFRDPASFGDAGKGEAGPALRFIAALVRSRKPLVAAVEGLAVGIGVTLLAHCDLVYAGAGASFQTPFVNLGLCPEAGSSLLLPRLLGRQGAARLLLLGEVLPAAGAAAQGLVTEVEPAGQALDRAGESCRRLAAQPPAALRRARELLLKDGGPELEERIALEGRIFGELLAAPEAREALGAFTEKRKPDFSRFS